MRTVVDLGDAGELGDVLLLGSGEATIDIGRSGLGEARSVVPD